MDNRTLVAGAGAILLALMVWWFTTRPQLIIALETDDHISSLIYHCTITTDAAEAEARANAAHVALQARAKVIGTDAGNKIQAAVEAADASGDIPDLGAIDAAAQVQTRALEADIQDQFGCDVDI